MADLDELAATGPAALEGRLAAWELALWHANQHSVDHAAQCLERLGTAIGGEGSAALRVPAAILAAECHGLLGQIKAGKRVLRKALRVGATPDLHLARANLEADIGVRLEHINEALSLSGVTGIALATSTPGSPYDRILVPGDLHAPKCTRLDAEAQGDELQPKVSVIVPAYNAEGTLAFALDSVLAQTWKNLEVLVVDDCSSDGTCAIVRRYAQLEPRVRPILAQVNGGPYVARNIALQVATGEFVTCSDADDWAHPRRIEVQVCHLLRNRDRMANTSQCVRMTEDLVALRRCSGGVYAQINMSSLLFRRTRARAALGYWDSVRFGADTEFLERMQKVFGQSSVVRLPSILSLVRVSDGSLTSHSAFGFSGAPVGARREYREASHHHHSSAKELRYGFPQAVRPFAIPLAMSPAASSKPRELAVVIVTDFRIPENAAWVLALLREGTSDEELGGIGLVQLGRYEVDPEVRIDPRIRALVDRTQVTFLVYGESATCQILLVKDLCALRDWQQYVPRLRASATVVIADESSLGMYVQSAHRHELRACIRHLTSYFGASGQWVPSSARAREQLQSAQEDSLHGLVALAQDDWRPGTAVGDLLVRFGQA